MFNRKYLHRLNPGPWIPASHVSLPEVWMIFWTVSHDLVEIHDLGCHSLSWMNRALGGFIRPTHMARQNISIVSEFKGKFARFFVQIWEVFDVTKMGENSMERIVFKFYIHGSKVNFQNVYWRCVIPIIRIPYERWYHHPLQLEGVFFYLGNMM